MPASGERLNQFELLEPLGKGGMGEVFLAQDSKLDRKVAIKFLPDALKKDPIARERFLRESKLAAALDHPYICKIYEIGEVEGKAFIAMEYVEGQTLQRRLKKGPLRLNQLLGLGIEIAEAVEAAHQKQIVHRDLKTANIMVTPEGHIKILDFGVAKHLAMDDRSESDASTFSGRLTSADTTPGTVIYMSPEQVREEPIDARTDLFSLGVVLYEMATGSVPFQGATSGMTYDLILNRGPVPVRGLNPDVPDDLERIIVKALEKERDHRYQSAKDLVVDLKRLKRDSSTPSMRPVSGSSAPVRTSPKKKNVWGVAGGVAAAVLVALGVLLFAPSVDAPSESIDSLAVLPFENVRNDPEVDYLSDGIAETLINRLSQIEQLHVMARSTAFRYRGEDIDPQTVGRELDVGAVLTGRVVHQEGRLNVQAELVDVKSGTQLWGEQYSRDFSDILDVQNEIAQEISDALRLKLTGEEQRQLVHYGTENTEAYQAYLKGRYFWGKRGHENLVKAIAFFEEAKRSDPDYALAFVGLADSHLLVGAYNPGPDTVRSEEMEEGRAAAGEALRLNPNLAEAYVSLAYIEFLYDWDWEASERDFLKAIELDPSYAVAYQWYGEFLSVMGRHVEAIERTRRAVELEPTSPIISRELGYKFLMARRYPEAIAQYLKTIELDPSFGGTDGMLTEAYWYGGMLEEAVAQAQNLDETTRRYYEAMARGDNDEAVELIDAAVEAGLIITVASRYYAVAGNKEKSLALLEESVRQRIPQVLVGQNQAGFDPYRSDPRFIAVRRSIGLEP